jgi:hypothetical protein
MRPPSLAAFFLPHSLSRKVFNIAVENSVEKGGAIFVTGSAADTSALCTEPDAGTFVV